MNLLRVLKFCLNFLLTNRYFFATLSTAFRVVVETETNIVAPASKKI
jgi:hypothetical protein